MPLNLTLSTLRPDLSGRLCSLNQAIHGQLPVICFLLIQNTEYFVNTECKQVRNNLTLDRNIY